MICRAATAPPIKDRNLFLSLINRSTTLAHLLQAHAQIIHTALQDDILLVTKLTSKLSDLGSISHASLLCSTFSKPDLFLYNVLIRGLARNKSTHHALSLYRRLTQDPGLKPDNFTYAFAISASSGFPSVKTGLLLHGHVIVNGYGSDLFVGSSIVDMYLKFSRVAYARQVFDKMPQRDTVLWNTVISGLVKNGCFEEAVGLFRDMVVGGVRVDLTTLTSVLPATAELQELSVGMMVQCLSIKVGFFWHEYMLTGLVSLYSKCGDMSTARLLFGQIQRRDLISYNAMISGFSCNRETESAVGLFNDLIVSWERVSSSTVVGLIPVYSPFGHLDLTRGIHSFCFKCGMVYNASVSTALTTVYSRLNETDLARKLFNESPEKSLAAWNAMISGYAQSGDTEMAISLFREMQSSEILPNHVTITCILSACAQLGALTVLCQLQAVGISNN
ncbi:hypothetical protein RJ639_019163 [Escallonia herrerae]|uniref:Pentatricopeptide repeat-containing protein n=1 Tax=Escallonia herrerae TaxID=1293975 RepID=A0AA88V9U9_9ASTE|nr:hypothetical protein RJ639_019163 [Escallonia herrerae]